MLVTARELKLRLGRYLAAVRRGETVRITMHGNPVAELRPLATSGKTRLDQLVAAGLATPGGGRLDAHSPAPAERSASALILADRESERA